MVRFRHRLTSFGEADFDGHNYEGSKDETGLGHNSMKCLDQRIAEALREEVSLEAYNPEWPILFAVEAAFLWATWPHAIIKRIEHFGSTAVPGLIAKPVIDVLVEVTDFEQTKKEVVPVLESHDYDYFWRTDVKVPYPWFIKRDANGKRTHHSYGRGRFKMVGYALL